MTIALAPTHLRGGRVHSAYCLCAACQPELQRARMQAAAEREKPALGEGSGVDVLARVEARLYPGRAYHALTADERAYAIAVARAELRAAGAWPESEQPKPRAVRRLTPRGAA